MTKHDMQPILQNFALLAEMGNPRGIDPGDAPADDYPTELAGVVQTAYLHAAHKWRPEDGCALNWAEVEVVRMPTSPECRRKSVTVSLNIDVQVDGDDLDDNFAEVVGAILQLCERAKGA